MSNYEWGVLISLVVVGAVGMALGYMWGRITAKRQYDQERQARGQAIRNRKA